MQPRKPKTFFLGMYVRVGKTGYFGPWNKVVLYCRSARMLLVISQGIKNKGQLISKATYGLLTSPKKRTDEFVLFAFLLFTANKSNLSVRFLEESTAPQSAFWFYLTFSILTLLQYTKTLLQGPKDPVFPTLMYVAWLLQHVAQR